MAHGAECKNVEAKWHPQPIQFRCVKLGRQVNEKRLAVLDAAIAKGIPDADAGRVKSGDEVPDRLEAKYDAMAERTK
ncbi:hypothetical protein [Mesorhizobium sanjuanii]|uniref:hypothetical protein n=1 Tax=Mesorhizobium sanjuanii TaxID=2037900 RepID=UPI001FDF901B|nr:hypothetical protein [Mesorhizobium sanjuanii]